MPLRTCSQHSSQLPQSSPLSSQHSMASLAQTSKVLSKTQSTPKQRGQSVIAIPHNPVTSSRCSQVANTINHHTLTEQTEGVLSLNSFFSLLNVCSESFLCPHGHSHLGLCPSHSYCVPNLHPDVSSVTIRIASFPLGSCLLETSITPSSSSSSSACFSVDAHSHCTPIPASPRLFGGRLVLSGTPRHPTINMSESTFFLGILLSGSPYLAGRQRRLIHWLSGL